MHVYVLYVLVNVPRRVHYGIFARGAGREANTARGGAECRIYLPRDPTPSAINPVVHETCGTLTVFLCDFQLRLYKQDEFRGMRYHGCALSLSEAVN